MKRKRLLNMKWKPLELDATLLNGNFEGLVGIEECSNYDLEDSDFKQTKEVEDEHPGTYVRINTKKRHKKRKESKHEPISSDNGQLAYTINLNDQLAEMEAWQSYGLPEVLLKALSDRGFIQPTQIQSLCLPPAILGRRDILGAAETGSGKTLAFGLPMLTGIMEMKSKNIESKVEDDPGIIHNDGMDMDVSAASCVEPPKHRKPLYGLILTPTRELAIQIKNHLTAVAKYTDIKISVVVGGMAAVKQERILNKCPEIVVATPGRLWELIQSKNAHLLQIDSISFLAIDETDRMLEKGHFQELHHILELINRDEDKRKSRQNFVFSATLTLVHELPKYLKSKKKIFNSKRIAELTPSQKLQKIIETLGISTPKIVDITKGTGTSSTLTECRITCSLTEKDYYVYYFLQKHPGRTLIFCNSIGCVKRVTTILNLLGCIVLPLHASMQQRQRLKNLDRFKEKDNSVLIATDVAARGLDIPHVDHVLHYQTPRTSESYVHRSGRTARAFNEGITVLIMEPSELQSYIKLCRTLGKTEDLPVFPVQENVLKAVKERVNVARELDKLELQVRKARSDTGWLQKAAENMDIIIEDVMYKYDKDESVNYKKAADAKRKHLAKLLAKPLFPKGFSGKHLPQPNEISLPLLNPTTKQEKAVDIMKTSLENYNAIKKTLKPVYKAKRKNKNAISVNQGRINKTKKS